MWGGLDRGGYDGDTERWDKSSPLLRLPLQTEFHKAVKEGAEGPAVRVTRRG